MTRLSRKKRTDIKLSLNQKSKNGLTDLMDDAMKSIWRINDDEYDYLCENLSDDDLYLFTLPDKITLSELKTIIGKVNQLVFYFQNKKGIERDIKLDDIFN
jgi:hypothetical protein